MKKRAQRTNTRVAANNRTPLKKKETVSSKASPPIKQQQTYAGTKKTSNLVAAAASDGANVSSLPSSQFSWSHVNIITNDWRALSNFYQQVFRCVPVPPQRDLQGPWLDLATGIKGAHLQGVHLAVPNTITTTTAAAPTLEIFQYIDDAPNVGAKNLKRKKETEKKRKAKTLSRPNSLGFGHICFAVPNVTATVKEVLRCGGSVVGAETTLVIPNSGKTITFQYVRDPDGNIIEVQRWS